MNKFILFALLVSFAISCKDNDSDDVVITVASEKGVCNIVNDFSCYIVKFNEQEDWHTITESIEGFDYVPGFEYVILVEKENLKNPPQDYSGKYILKQVISKTEKNSTGLPGSY